MHLQGLSPLSRLRRDPLTGHEQPRTGTWGDGVVRESHWSRVGPRWVWETGETDPQGNERAGGLGKRTDGEED